MKRLLVLLLLLTAQSAFAQPVVVRVTAKPESGAVIGQRIAIWVDVLFVGEMPRPPRVAIPEVAGAQILRFESQATTMSERIDGTVYAGQRFEFALYGRRGGLLTVPAPVVTLFDKEGGETGSAGGPSIKVEIAVPPGVDPSRPVIATTEARLVDQWQPAPDSPFKTGDAVVRIVTREAADVPAMAMPDLAFAAPAGVRVYVDPPQSEDRQERGAVTGRRVDKATYVFGSGGRFVLPGVAQQWWDLAGNRLKTESVPAVTVSVAALPTAPDSRRLVALGLVLVVFLAALGLGWPRVRAWRSARRARWLASEPKAFEDLSMACRTGDVRRVYDAFLVWRRRTRGPAGLAPLAIELEQALFGGDVGRVWTAENARDFDAKLRVLRQEQERAQGRYAQRTLPPLNPLFD